MMEQTYYTSSTITSTGEPITLSLDVEPAGGTLSATTARVHLGLAMTPDELRRLAGALLDASDAVENAQRTGRIKERNPHI